MTFDEMLEQVRELLQSKGRVAYRALMWRFLEAARESHSPLDYQRLAVPYLLQLQERQQEVIEYLSRQATLPDTAPA